MSAVLSQLKRDDEVVKLDVLYLLAAFLQNIFVLDS